MRKTTENYYSINNQKIIDKLINREVMCLATDIVEYILETSSSFNLNNEAPFTDDDICNSFRKICPECGSNAIEIDEDDLEPIKKWKCDCCGELFDSEGDAFACCSDIEEEYNPKEIWLCPICSDEYDSKEEAKECSCHYKENIYKCKNSNCNSCFLEFDANEKYNEVYEWWLVTDWFADKLKEHGEVIIDSWHKVWGRCTSGQAISLDSVIVDIAEEMEILVGQRHDWSDYL